MGRPFRLLVMDIRWPPETFLERKLRALAAAGFQVTVLTPGPDGGGETGGIRVWRVKAGVRGLASGVGLLMRALLRAPVPTLEGTLRLRSRARGGALWKLLVRHWAVEAADPDVTHFEWTLAAAPALPLMEDPARRFTVSCRGSQVSVATWSDRRAKETGLLPGVFERCTMLHAVSEATAAAACALGATRDRVVVIRPGVEVPTEGAGPAVVRNGTLQVGMSCSLRWVKAFEHALTAFRRALDKGLDAVMVVMGGADKENRARFLYTVQDLGLEGRVDWKGAVRAEEVMEVLRGCDVFLLSSLSEGISNAVLEAMSCGLPVVVTDAGGMREAVRDGVEGFVVPVRDVEAMAEALVKLGRDPELRRRMGEAGRRRVMEEFTLERQTREWRAFYEKAAGEARR